jgi:hypothetical protein
MRFSARATYFARRVARLQLLSSGQALDGLCPRAAFAVKQGSVLDGLVMPGQKRPARQEKGTRGLLGGIHQWYHLLCSRADLCLFYQCF